MPREDKDMENERLANSISQAVVDGLIEKASDEKVVAGILTVWSKEMDRVIGRGIRRFLLFFLVGIAIAKFEWLGKLWAMVK